MEKIAWNQPVFVANQCANEWTVINEVTSSGQENAFFVCDINNIIQKYRIWKTVLPRIEPHYAVKCNDNLIVLQVLAALGAGFDCASKNEITKVLNIGVDPSRIIHALPTKPLNHIQYARDTNVNLTTFDNELELYKLKKLFPQVRAIIRIRYDAKAYCSLGLKFGCDPTTEAPLLLQTAQKLGINVVGVSFHVGSDCIEPSAFYGAIAAAKNVFNCASELGFKFDILDIGGGYPGNDDIGIMEYASIINKAIDEHFPDKDSVRLISEPGRYFVASAFTLVCNIHSIKKIGEDHETTFSYYINDGIFGSMNDVVYCNGKNIPPPIPYKTHSSSKKYRSIIWGPTCDSLDRIASDIFLPEMSLGDWFVFNNMGAYSLSLCTPFNAFDPPDMFAFINTSNWRLLEHKLHFPKQEHVTEAPITRSVSLT